jgi:hypothetical protein
MKNILIAVAALALTLAVSLGTPAQAANCSSYPYTLTNGQVADATQVMANFNNILACGNSNLAHNAANSDITSLSGLLTPLSASQGGTGQATSIFSTANTWALNQTFATSTTSIPSINIPPGVAPSAPTNGDVWATSAGLFARVAGATVLITAPTSIHVRHQLATTVANNETVGGSAWVTRLLETTVTNTISGASLASNKVTLPAGTYSVVANAPFCTDSGGNVRFKHRIYNVTDAAVILYSLVGNMAIEDTGGVPAQAFVPLIGQFTLAAAKDVRLDTWTDMSGTTHGNCLPANDGSAEVYVDLLITKIG